MQVTPPAGAAPSQAPSNGPTGQAGPAEQAILMIQKGFQQLAKLMQAAGDKLDPEDMDLFKAAVAATDNFIQALVGGEGDEAGENEAPPRPGAKPPMPMNANANAKPAPQY